MADKSQKDSLSTPPAPEPIVDIPAVHLDVLRRTGQPVEWWALLGMAAAGLTVSHTVPPGATRH
jgi:hypothetical protein